MALYQPYYFPYFAFHEFCRPYETKSIYGRYYFKHIP